MNTIIKVSFIILGLIYSAIITASQDPCTKCYPQDLGGAICTFHNMQATDNEFPMTFYCSIPPTITPDVGKVYLRSYNIQVRGFSPNGTLIVDADTLNTYHFEAYFRPTDSSDSRVVAFEAGHIDGFQVICLPGDGGRPAFR